MIKILENADVSGSWCYQYSKWFSKKISNNNHKFYRVTLIDNKKKIIRATNSKIRILTKLSSFAATSTLISLNYLFHDVFPLLEHRLKDIDYEIHVIGKGGLPKNLKNFAKHKKIIIRGFVKDLDKEINLSDVVLFPNPAEIGLRCRILNAFANYGCCVIHKSDSIGIPEIKNFKNCLVGNDAKQISDLTFFAIKNKKKRIQIKKNARKTFGFYNSKNSIKPILEDIKKIVH
jgi:glycosyltransferase involved in cell wall biosynthesis